MNVETDDKVKTSPQGQVYEQGSDEQLSEPADATRVVGNWQHSDWFRQWEECAATHSS